MTAVVRTYQPGDEESIVELSNRCLAPYAGWVPRTVEYWRWSTLTRPGVEPADILLLDSDSKIVGYTALGKDGSVLDFHVEPDQPSGARRRLIQQLVGALEERARARECDVLSFLEPSSDSLVDQTLRASGYVVEQSQCFSLGILNPLALLQQTLASRRAELESARVRAFVLELSAGGYPFLLNSRLLLQLDPDVQVRDISDAADHAQECVIRTDLCALTELIFCSATVDSLLQQAQLEIRPAASVPDARKLLEAVAIRAQWHVPRSDGF